jgi:uncharacterized protein YbaA (DUF1428 family)
MVCLASLCTACAKWAKLANQCSPCFSETGVLAVTHCLASHCAACGEVGQRGQPLFGADLGSGGGKTRASGEASPALKMAKWANQCSPCFSETGVIAVIYCLASRCAACGEVGQVGQPLFAAGPGGGAGQTRASGETSPTLKVGQLARCGWRLSLRSPSERGIRSKLIRLIRLIKSTKCRGSARQTVYRLTTMGKIGNMPPNP